MRIDVYSDMVCPWCRIGKKNLSDAIAEWSAAADEPLEVVYHAFQLDPTLPPEGMPFRQNMAAKFGGADKLAPMFDRVTQAGAEVGLTFRFDRVERMPNTLLAHRITALLPEGRQGDWIDAVMSAYFEYGRDIAQQDVLLDLAERLGFDREELAARLADGDGAAEVQADLDNAHAMGISGVPFFVLDNKYGLSGAYPPAQFIRAFQKIKATG